MVIPSATLGYMSNCLGAEYQTERLRITKLKWLFHHLGDMHLLTSSRSSQVWKQAGFPPSLYKKLRSGPEGTIFSHSTKLRWTR